MSFGFSPADIATIVRLATQIYEKCFTKAQAADQKYLQFGEEIKHFAESLQRLNDVFHHVDNQRQIRPWLPYDAAQVKFTLKPLLELTGDFSKTLKACEGLLSDNSKFRHNAAGFVDNVKWWLGTETEINNLKERIRFHSTKILLIAKPLEIQLLSDLRQDIWDVRKVVEEIRGLLVPNVDQVEVQRSSLSARLPPVPPELDIRFIAASNNKSGLAIDIKNFPLKEGFDALVFHFGQDILGEYHRFESGQLISPGDDVIFRLQEHCFSIWIDDQSADITPTLADEGPSEEKLLEIALPKPESNRKPRLIIFRKSDHELRIVCTTKDDQNEKFYEAENIHKIQQAVTGYNVGADIPNVSWNTYKTTENGKGRVQIWRAKSLPRSSSTEGLQAQSPTSPTTGLRRQATSVSSITLAESVAASVRGSLIHGSTGVAVSFAVPEIPVVVLYTLFKDKWTFMHFQVDKKVFLNHRACHCEGCKGPKKLCRRIVIESKGKLEIKRHSADARDPANTWDLALLRRPQHPKSLKSASLLTVKYIVFSFATVQAKDAFQTTFEAAERLRDIEQREYLSAISGLKRK